ncbi:PREDICTED: dosage compensation protein dpy-30-like [Priapulus caudatus]|uniref:Protein dpy-30 homolog n=1 Tax=Priapulus caudatus TaxID=37621 RepID=A0ABM1DSR3_PRICU|nr:PREDICTED: dosage compensation protein dpy-30-like [Priapulus caudatus]
MAEEPAQDVPTSEEVKEPEVAATVVESEPMAAETESHASETPAAPAEPAVEPDADPAPVAEDATDVKADETDPKETTAASGDTEENMDTSAPPPDPTEDVKKILGIEKQEQSGVKRSKVDLQALPTRQYLDHTIVPILLQGLSLLAKERPLNPIEYLAAFLLKNKNHFDS